MNSYIIRGMLIACLFYPLHSKAQNQIDALRYSQVMTAGTTARSLSMGGAFGALGADFSSLSTNPAGIGVYRKSEFTFSLGFNTRITESKFLNNIDESTGFNVDVPNAGLVLAFPKKNENAEWKQFGFALGYNRTANFNSESFYYGKNNNNSLLDSYVDQVQLNGGATPEDLFYAYPFDIDLAYQTYLLNPLITDSTQYTSVIPNGGAYQSRKLETSGGMGEFSLGFGGSYEDKVYFGVTVGFPTIRYEEEAFYEEKDVENNIISGDTISGFYDFESMRYDKFLRTIGNGFNGKFGLIFRPVNWLRIGAAIHTPTYYYMHDEYRSAMFSTFGTGESYNYASPDGGFSYNLTTPFRAIGSLAIIFAKQGLISVDYEMTDYSSAKLKAEGVDIYGNRLNFSAENKVIQTLYTGFASNLRAGMEWKVNNLAFRVGAAYYSSPFSEEAIENNLVTNDTDQHVICYTGGIGYRGKSFFYDIGYSFSQRSEYFQTYSLSYEEVPGVIQKRTDHKVVTTLGFRF